MTYTLAVVFLLPAWGFAYWLLRRCAGDDAGESRLQARVAWLHKRLDEMFLPVEEKTLRRGLLLWLLCAALLGLALPSTMSGVSMLRVNKAVQLNKEGKYKEARDILRDLEAVESPLVHNELGVAHLGLGDYENALTSFRRALQIHPVYAKAHANLATAYGAMENFERRDFERARAKEMAKYPPKEEEIYALGRSPLSDALLRVCLAGLLLFGAWKTPPQIIRLMRARRLKRYQEQLPDGLIMASNGLKAGFSLLQAMDVVATETAAPLSQEFRLVLKEHRLGSDLNDALLRLAERMPSNDTRLFVNAVIILRETGGNLTEIFDTLASTIKERKRVLEKIDTLTAEGRTQAYILSVLPVVLCLIMYKLNPEDVSLLFTTALGWMLIAIMALLEIVGLTWMLKMVKVNV
jgi:tight adherence protein B